MENRLFISNNVIYVHYQFDIDDTLNSHERKFVNVINDDAVKLLKMRIADDKDDFMCPITMDQIVKGDEICELPCSHKFKKDAILKWLNKEDNKCPVCRSVLPSKEIRVNEETNDHSDDEDEEIDFQFHSDVEEMSLEELERYLLETAMLESLMNE